MAATISIRACRCTSWRCMHRIPFSAVWFQQALHATCMLVNVLCRPDSVIQCVACCLRMELAEFDCSDRPANQEVMIANIFQLYRLISFITTHWCVQSIHCSINIINCKREDDSSSKTTIQRLPYKITRHLFTTKCFLNGKCCVARHSNHSAVFHITCLVHFPYDITIFYSFARNYHTS